MAQLSISGSRVPDGTECQAWSVRNDRQCSVGACSVLLRYVAVAVASRL